MDKIFLGFLFLFLNVNLNFEAHTLNVLPDWLGYIFLLQGAKALLHESELFQKPRPWCIAMVVYTGALWIADLLAITPDNSISVLLGFVGTLLHLYIAYLFIRALFDVEERRGVDLQCAHLKKVWCVTAIASVVATGLPLVLSGDILVLVAIPLLVGFVAGIVFLVAVNRTRKLYNDLCAV